MQVRIRHGNNTNKYFLLLWIAAYRIMLDVVYTMHLSTEFGYAGFTTKYLLDRYFISWILIIFAMPVIRTCIRKTAFSDTIVLFLIYLSYIPFTTMVAFFSLSWQYILANSIYWANLFLAYRFRLVIRGNFTFPTFHNHIAIYAIEALFGITIAFISWRYTGFRFTVSLKNVYLMRSDENLRNIPLLLSYIFSASKATMPVLLTYSLKTKNKLNALIIVFLQIMSYSINGSKLVLFSTLLAVGGFYLYNVKYLAKVPMFLSGLCVLSYLETAVFHRVFILAYFIRRVFFVPNQLNYYYFQFFSSNKPDYYRQSFLRFLGFKSEYSDIDHLIGEQFFGRANMGANNGLFSDAITNMGIVGVFVLPIILILLLRFLDFCAKDIDKHIYISTSVIFSFIFISSFLPTVLLTHGLLMLCLVLVVLPREEKKRRRHHT